MLRVGDLQRSIDFYTKVMGMQLHLRTPGPWLAAVAVTWADRAEDPVVDDAVVDAVQRAVREAVRLANITPRDDAVRVMNASLTAPMSGIADVARVPQPASADGSGVWLQLGAFGAQGNAEAFRQRMQSLASSNDVEGRLELVNRDGLYKVRIGPFVTVSRAREVAERLNVQTVVMR